MLNFSSKSDRVGMSSYPDNMILMPHIEFGNQPTRPSQIAFYSEAIAGRYS